MNLQLIDTTNVPEARMSCSGSLATEKSPVWWQPRQFREEAEQCGLRQAVSGDLAEAHQLAEDLVRARMAPLSALIAAHAQTEGSAWIYQCSHADSISGVFLTLPLNVFGESALLHGKFTALAPDPAHLCAPGDPVTAMYLWFVGGRSLRARVAVVKTALAWRDGAYSRLRVYARAATSDGARGLAHYGFEPVAHLGLMLRAGRT